MNFHILTLFPEMVMQGLNTSITGRAIRENKITVEAINIRDFSTNKHRKVDDYTYGGGAGMLMQPQPVYDAYQSVAEHVATRKNSSGVQNTGNKKLRTIYVTPQGHTFNQRMAQDFAREEDLVILCGHYEGIDERVLEEVVTDYVSIGDYVLTGGELAAMVITDAISRLVPGVLNNEVSAETESFHNHLLEYPQYSRPEVWHDKEVPKVLLSGNKKEVEAWRLQKSIERTRERRPDLYEQYQKLDACVSELMKQKLLHMDMLELIRRGNAKIMYHKGEEILLKDLQTGNFLYTNPEGDMGIKYMDATMFQKATVLYVHQKNMAHKMALVLQAKECIALCQFTCTRKEKLPVSGLYRPDGKPMTSGVEGLVIVPNEADGKIYARLESQDEALGYIKVNKTGCIDELYVEETYRNRKIGSALVTYVINQQLEEGITPYVQVEASCVAAHKLLEKLGLYKAKTEIMKLILSHK